MSAPTGVKCLPIAKGDLHQVAEQLLRVARIDAPIHAITPVRGGRNNRAYQLKTAGSSYFLKQYLHQPGDKRSRLHQETSFLAHCRKHDINATTKVISKIDSRHVALYSWVEGTPFSESNPTKKHLGQAIDFFTQLNTYNTAASAVRLSNASDASFSAQEHLCALARRIKRLEYIRDDSPLHKRTRRFCHEKLRPAWRHVNGHIRRLFRHNGSHLKKNLITSQRCISPSDFGFHNTLHSGENVIFIDFEYAGWDDPAKMVADFFCQPEHPPAMNQITEFAQHVFELFDNPVLAHKRLQWLLPLTQLKWCCLLLNEFQPVAATQRQFAYGQDDLEPYLDAQLQKSIRQFNKMELIDHEIRA